MNQKRICWEIALCIVAGVLAGVGLAFRFQLNTYIAATIGGLVGALFFHPKEILALCWKFAKERYPDIIALFCIVTVLAMSVAFHRFIATQIPYKERPTSGFDIIMVYVLGFIAMLFTVAFLHGDGYRIPSWKMPLTLRIRRYWDGTDPRNAGSTAVTIVISVICIVFFAPLFSILAIVFLAIVIIDLVTTVAMFITQTPRLAIMWGASIGTLFGCCFSSELWQAIVLGSAIGVPCGLCFQKLRWYLSSEIDRRKPEISPETA